MVIPNLKNNKRRGENSIEADMIKLGGKKLQ